MTTRLKSAPARSKTVRRSPTPATVLYLYAISKMPQRLTPGISAESIDGSGKIEGVRCEKYLCWISRVSKTEFADRITERMQDLEWLAAASLRHQRAVAEISAKLPSLPARFATVFLSEDSLGKHVTERDKTLRVAFRRVADADEWGVKIFALAQPKAGALTPPASGSEYLKRKAAQLQSKSVTLDADIRRFIDELDALAVASTPGGKASAGQPGLTWHGSILVRKQDRSRLESLLRRYARSWKDLRRIDCSGPWPPYSFVGEHV
jgi:Gas vesicle synthesis protein GvpL/GvpF